MSNYREKEAERENQNYVISAEYQVLKLMIEYPELDYFDVTENSFLHKIARALFNSILILEESDEKINEGSILRVGNSIYDKIDMQTVKYLFSFEVDPSSHRQAIKTLSESSKKFKLEMKATELKTMIESNDPLDQNFALTVLSQMQDIVILDVNDKSNITLEQLCDTYKEELILRKEGRSYPFSDSWLNDNLTRKGAPGQIILLAGGTGTGKSAYCLEMINGDINLGYPAIYFCLEMDQISTMDRLISRRTGIPINDWYKSGNDMDSLLDKLEEERKDLINKPFWLIDDVVSLPQIQNKIKEFKAKYKVQYLRVYIDLITMVPEFMNTRRGGTIAGAMELSINQLLATMKKENACGICVAQFNREPDAVRITEPDQIGNLRPGLHHVKNSHALGERARTVLGCFRPKYLLGRMFPENEEVELMADEFQVQILKQSQGSTGQIGHYLFDGPTMTLTLRAPEDLEEEDSEEGTVNIAY